MSARGDAEKQTPAPCGTPDKTGPFVYRPTAEGQHPTAQTAHSSRSWKSAGTMKKDTGPKNTARLAAHPSAARGAGCSRPLISSPPANTRGQFACNPRSPRGAEPKQCDVFLTPRHLGSQLPRVRPRKQAPPVTSSSIPLPERLISTGSVWRSNAARHLAWLGGGCI